MTRSARALLLLAIVGGAVDAGAAAAQAIADLELAGGGVRASGRDGTRLGLLTARAGLAADRWHVAAAASVAWLAQGGSATYAAGLLGGRVPLTPALRLLCEISGGEGRDLGRDASSFVRGAATAELAAGPGTLRLGASHAWAWLPESDRTTAGLRLTGGRRVGPVMLETGAVLLRSRETLSPAIPGPAEPVRRWAGDLTLALRWQCRRCELSLLGNWRLAGRDVAGPRSEAALAGSVEAAWWPAEHVALVLTGGSAPGELERGLAPVSSIRAGLRVGWRRPYLPPPAGPPLLTVIRLGPSSYRLRLRRADTGALFLRGDFSGWAAVPLQPGGPGLWTTPPVRRAPGPVRIQMSTDGITWIPIPGLPRGISEFGGEASVLVLEPAM